MRRNGKGGMQTARADYSIYCPKCGKPAARQDIDYEKGIFRYLHFTNSGYKWHEVTIEEMEKR